MTIRKQGAMIAPSPSRARRSVMGLMLFLGVCAGGCAPDPPESGTSASAEHEIHVQSADLTRIINAAMRATGALPQDTPPVPAPTAANAIEALDHADVTYGLALSGAYFWGIPSLRSAPLLDSLGVDIGNGRDRVRAENLYLAEQIARYPDRLVGACSVNPLAQYALEELELCAADPRITAFSLNLAPAPVDFRDESHVASLRTFFEALARTDLAVIVHMRNRGEGYGAGDAGVFIREVLATAPGVPVQIAHMAGWGPYDEATDSAMQAFVDAFEDGTLDRDRFTFGVGVVVDDPEEMDGDTARARAAAERNARLAERMRQVGIERVVFSTDWPFFPPDGDPRTRIARNRARMRNVLPLEPAELDRFFSNVGPVFRHLVESHSSEQGSRE
ncbi:MAG TPA: amidohydrolase family protein [Longimicrobiales bacterium]|nr:amidohydrolase family protein [Longimicrobiales bacterium]